MRIIDLVVKRECSSCGGTGLYSGLAERDGAAVVCNICDGTGCEVVRVKGVEFIKRKRTRKVDRVYQVNPGICIGKGKDNQYKLEDFGGMTYDDWVKGKSFPVGSENRRFTCPAWWYQLADYDKKPQWKECGWGSFSSCSSFCNKDKCWERWDREYKK